VLLQCRAIASHASNILPGSEVQFHRAETTRQAVYAKTRPCTFGNGARSGPPTMRAAKRNGPSVERGHRLRVIPVYDSSASAGHHCLRCRSQTLCKIAHLATEGRQRGDLHRADQQVVAWRQIAQCAACRGPAFASECAGRIGEAPATTLTSGLPASMTAGLPTRPTKSTAHCAPGWTRRNRLDTVTAIRDTDGKRKGLCATFGRSPGFHCWR
jgi:hypothetical protein